MRRSAPELVEHHILRWRAERNTPTRLISTEAPRPDVVAISREVGTEAEAVAGAVSEQLGIPLFDHAAVEHIARTAHVHLETVQTLAQHVQGRVEEYLSGLFRERNFDRSEYLFLLARSIVSLWEHGPCVLMGHGAVHLLPRDHALKVRLIGSFEARVAQLAKEKELAPPEAERRIRRADAEQHAFHRRFFGEDGSDPHHYDLIVDCGRFDGATCARLIAEAYRERFC